MKFLQIGLMLFALAVQCFAVPASDETFFLKQPDGTSIEVRQRGDDRFHVLETADGYILQKDVLGYYAYADELGESSGIYARNALDRSEADMHFLARLDPESIFEKLLSESPTEETLVSVIPKFAYPRIQRMPAPNYTMTMGEFRGFVMLIQFSDIKFKSDNPQKQFSDYMNKEGFNEYANHGSVRDYFIKNSMEKFIPTFDVYGPVTVSGDRASYGAISKNDRNFAAARRAFKEGIDSLIKQGVDFSKYDKNNDGDIDFFFIIYAGVGSHNSPVVESIWPHAGYLGKKGTLKSGKKVAENYYINHYACANEISGRAYKSSSTTSVIEGIGGTVHELGHVLGLPDLYDTKNKHNRKTPSYWDVMASGNYNCPSNTYNVQGCAPPFYTAFERMSLGWLTPTELNATGLVRLDKIDNNVAYSITNPKNPNEVFLLEYRSKKDWDIGQRSSGMLIWHIDYVDSIWKKLIINTDSSHMYVDIVEAVPEKVKYATADDPFPGAGNVTEFSKFIFWKGDSMEIALSNITESLDKEYVTFNVDMVLRSSSSENFSSSSISSSSSSMLLSSSFIADMSSSSAVASSSSIENSSSSAEWFSSAVASSSSVEWSSSSVASSSSEMLLFSSSEIIESSSSQHTVFAALTSQPRPVQVQMHNGSIFVYAPQQGQKIVRLFTPLGTLLFEIAMDGHELEIKNFRKQRNANCLLSIQQGRQKLFTGTIFSSYFQPPTSY